MLLILILCLPFIFACGEKANNEKATEANNTVTEAPAVEAPPTDPPPPTEPPTEKPTEPPTEPPTDPANLPAPVIYKQGENEFPIIPGARYYLWSPNCNLYLTVDGDFSYAGFSQDDYTGKPEQMFVFELLREEVGDTSTKYVYKIRALGTKEGYLDLDDPEELKDGMGVICNPASGEISQEWILKAQKSTNDKKKNKFFDDIKLPLFSVASNIPKNTSRCLDVSGVSESPGGMIHLWSGGSALNQKWFFELVSDVESGKIIPRGLQEIPAEFGMED